MLTKPGKEWLLLRFFDETEDNALEEMGGASSISLLIGHLGFLGVFLAAIWLKTPQLYLFAMVMGAVVIGVNAINVGAGTP